MPGKCSNSLELPDLIFAWTGNEPSPRGLALRRRRYECCLRFDSDPNSASLNRMVPIADIWLLETLIDMKGQLN